MSDRLFDVEPPEPPGPSVASRPGEPPAAVHGDVPLATRMRPRDLDEIVGQQALVGPGGPLRAALERDALRSVVLWGPPGTGKTTLAGVIAGRTARAFTELSAVTSGVKDVRAAVEAARARRASVGRGTVLFIDELHRFSRTQQDALLPGVEDGSVVLVGATTENPSFSVVSPLLSRSLLYRLEPLGEEDQRALVDRALADERGLLGITLAREAETALVLAADGDARALLGGLEAAAGIAAADGRGDVSAEDVRAGLSRPHLRYDRAGDQHYDHVSALIKSVRGSDPDAALYWMVRMIEAGEDPRFVTRRLLILASEDIGLADPAALPQAVAASDALERLGLPEAMFALAQATLYLALAPKSNSVTTALGRARDAVRRLGDAPVPPALRDAHYKGAERLGHGAGYRYPHDDERGWVEQRHAPSGIEPGDLYQPSEHGGEPGLQAWRGTREVPVDEPDSQT